MCVFNTHDLIQSHKIQLYSLKDSLNILHSSRKQSEFGLVEQLGACMQTIDALNQTSLNKKIQNHEQIAQVLQEIASRIGSIQTNYYFRAGRAYFTINHGMGPAGNLFFKSVFENLLQDAKENCHFTTQENSFCAIIRI